VLTAAADDALPFPEFAIELVAAFRAEAALALVAALARPELDFATTVPTGRIDVAVPLAGPPEVLT
jgi:hypothetical protein